ncbi:MAG: DUF3303 family protein [Acidobacteria bacterium]|nr:DUF3303 family protein [Acidobacteriota bacterium]MBK9527244.1 DUF3303 family protein [Acidobacteriota bacterium]MBP7476207.1 DUF3303 family protein [Pyrinomonadaceae bacterium]MBP9108232.1 DUF3303 family protein [Pyrinomonadaceae bacterium]
MLFMVVEHFKDRDPAPVYKRFAEQGRLMPEGLSYVNSWIEVGMDRCFQVMETDDPALLQEWIKNWGDLVDFEVVPVVTSAEMVDLFASKS